MTFLLQLDPNNPNIRKITNDLPIEIEKNINYNLYDSNDKIIDTQPPAFSNMNVIQHTVTITVIEDIPQPTDISFTLYGNSEGTWLKDDPVYYYYELLRLLNDENSTNKVKFTFNKMLLYVALSAPNPDDSYKPQVWGYKNHIQDSYVKKIFFDNINTNGETTVMEKR